MPTVHRSLAISMGERYTLVVLGLASSIVIARLLTPEEIGIYAIAAALIGIAQVVRDFGIGSYLIQEKDLTDDPVRSAFGVSLIIGALLFATFIVGAPIAGEFYRDARIVGIVRIIAFNFLLMPFCSISLSLLRRNMQFGRIMAANTTGTVLGMVASCSISRGRARGRRAWRGTRSCNGDAMDEKYVAATTNVTVFAWPFYGLAALFPLELMRLLFGPQWDEG